MNSQNLRFIFVAQTDARFSIVEFMIRKDILLNEWINKFILNIMIIVIARLE